jgi:hypothetical protein
VSAHLSSLAAALQSSADRESRARVFAGLADEALTLADTAPSRELLDFWLGLHEDFFTEARTLQEPVRQPKKRRWFR